MKEPDTKGQTQMPASSNTQPRNRELIEGRNNQRKTAV